MVRVAGFAGIASALFGFFAAFFPIEGQFPNVSSTPGQVAAFYTVNHDSLIVSSAVAALIFVVLIPFAAGEYAMLRPREGEGSAWSLVGALGIVGAGVVFSVYGAINLGLAYAASGPLKGQEGVIAAIAYVSTALGGFGSVFLALFLAGFGLAGLRSGAAPRWSSWLALAGAALAFTGVAGAFSAGFWNEVAYIGGTLGLLVWVLVESVRMIRASPGAVVSVARRAVRS